MTITHTDTRHAANGALRPRLAQLKESVRERTEALNHWAGARPAAMRHAAEERPFLLAGVAAGAAFIGGLTIGLLLSGRIAPMQQRAMSTAHDRADQGARWAREAAAMARRRFG